MPHIHGLNKRHYLIIRAVAATVFLGAAISAVRSARTVLWCCILREPEISEEEVLRFLKSDRILEGSVFPREPTLSADLEDFIVKIREMDIRQT